MSSIIQSSAFKNIFDLRKSSTFLTMLTLVIGYFLGPYFGLISNINPSDYSLLYGAAAMFSVDFGSKIIYRGLNYVGTGEAYWRKPYDKLPQSATLLGDTTRRILATCAASGGALYLMGSSSALGPMVVLSAANALYQNPFGADTDYVTAAANVVIYCSALHNIPVSDEVKTKISDFIKQYIPSVILGDGAAFTPVVERAVQGPMTLMDIRRLKLLNPTGQYGIPPPPPPPPGYYESMYANMKNLFEQVTNGENYSWENMQKIFTSNVDSVKAYSKEAWNKNAGTFINEEKKAWAEGKFKVFTDAISAAFTWLNEVYAAIYEQLETSIGKENLPTVAKIVGFVVAGMLVSWFCKKMYDRLYKNTKPAVSKFDDNCLNEFGSITYRGFNTITQLFQSVDSNKEEDWNSNLPILIKFFTEVGFENQSSCPSYLINVKDAFEKFLNILSITKQDNRGDVVLGFLELMLNFQEITTNQARLLKSSVTENYILKIDSIEKYTTFELAELSAMLYRKIEFGEKILKDRPAIDRGLFTLIEASEKTNKKIGVRVVQKDLSMTI